jgi:hypothetical protein
MSAPYGKVGERDWRGCSCTVDFAAFFAAVDDARRERDMGWHDLAGELREQSAQLNAGRDDHPICGGAVSRLGARGETSCQCALYLLRWLGAGTGAAPAAAVRTLPRAYQSSAVQSSPM